MKKRHFPMFLATFLAIAIGCGFFFYTKQRERHVQVKLEQLQDNTRTASRQISYDIEQINKEFEYFANLRTPQIFYRTDATHTQTLIGALKSSLPTFTKALHAIYIFDQHNNAKSYQISPNGIHGNIHDQGLFPADLPKEPGTFLLERSLFLVIRPAKASPVLVCLELNYDALLAKNLVSAEKPRQSMQLLLGDNDIISAKSVNFSYVTNGNPRSIRVKIPRNLKQAVLNGQDGLSTITANSEKIVGKYFLVCSPVIFGSQKLNLLTLSPSDVVLELVNANHYIFLSLFALAVIFSLLLVILKFMLNIQQNISAELATQNNIFSLLINSMPIGVAIKDFKHENRYIICNLAAAHIFNQPIDKIIGKQDEEIFSPEVVKKHKTQDDRVERSNEVEIVEKELADYGDGGIWLRTTRLPLFSPDGEVTMLMRVVEDVTHSVKLENQLQHAQRMDEVGKLAGGIAHEFNNLLQVILGYCEFIRSETDLTAIAENLEQIEKAGNSAMHLTRQLLTYSRKTEMKKEPVELGKVITEGLRMVSRLIGDDIEISFRNTEEPLIVLADTAQIEQILINLCINARDAMNGKGQISITLQKTNEVHEAIALGIRQNQNTTFAHLQVTDNGPGIQKTHRDRLFEPFFTTKEIGKGTGLGLAIVYAIMKQHEGYIFAANNAIYGAAFDIYLPIFSKGMAADATTVKTKVENRFTAADLLVLVAEDEDAVRQMCVKLLLKHGFKVIEAKNGEEAVELFQQNKDKISLLIFDVMMPKMTGKTAYDIISKIKPGIPTIFCTGYSGESLKTELTTNNKVVLLDKPYKTTKLLETINTLLG